jgi:dihydroxy-acid dehydratase
LGGPIALVQNGDTITIDADTLTLQVAVSDEELAARKQKWTNKDVSDLQGTLKKYNKLVGTASQGCVTDL